MEKIFLQDANVDGLEIKEGDLIDAFGIVYRPANPDRSANHEPIMADINEGVSNRTEGTKLGALTQFGFFAYIPSISDDKKYVLHGANAINLETIRHLMKFQEDEFTVDQSNDRILIDQKAFERNLHIGFIFQTYNLLPVYTVYENVEFALLLQNLSGSERKKAVMDALEWVGLTDKVKSKPSMLSGGECQRVAIARSMVKRPEIVLADEPTANLDSQNSNNILQTMKSMNRELKTTFIFATHDEKVMKYLNRIISLQDGKIMSDDLMKDSKN